MSGRDSRTALSLTCFGLVCGFAVAAVRLPAQDASRTARPLLQQTLTQRTALFHDPTLVKPLRQLVDTFSTPDHTDALIALYEQQIQNFPQDISSTLVLTRILHQLGDSRAAGQAQQAVDRFPHVAYAHYLHALTRTPTDPAAIVSLDQAIQLERDPRQREVWINELLPLAERHGRRDMLKQNLMRLAEIHRLSARELLQTARSMHDYGLDRQALQVLTDARALQPDAQLVVEIDLLAARSQTQLGETDSAARDLDDLLARVAIDQPLHKSILAARLELLRTEQEEAEFLRAARARFARSDGRVGAMRELVQILQQLHRDDEARELLEDGLRQQPKSRVLEAELLQHFDRTKQNRAKLEFLKVRLQQEPERTDLQIALIQSEYLAGEAERAEHRLAALLEGQSASKRFEDLVTLARRLHGNGQRRLVADLLARACTILPGRLDVRREAAAMLLQLEDHAAAEALLNRPIPKTVELAAVLELAEFLIEVGLPATAHQRLEEQLPAHAESLDLQLALARTGSLLDNPSEPRPRLATARRFVRSPAAYRRWLAAALSLIAPDELEAFLIEEFRETGPGGTVPSEASAGATAYQLALLELAGERLPPEVALKLIETTLAKADDPKAELSLRRTLLKSLQPHDRFLPKAEEQVERLLQLDATRRSEYYAVLAVMYSRNSGRAAELQEALAHVDVTELHTAQQLNALRPAILQAGDPVQTETYLQTATRIDPANAEAWRLLLACQLWQNDERGFRRSARRLLSNVAGADPTPQCRARLEEQIVISLWREARRHIRLQASSPRADATESLRQAQLLLDQAATQAHGQNLSLAILWTRADCLRRLGRDTEFAEARAAFDAATASGIQHATNSQDRLAAVEMPPDRCLMFPDGVVMEVDYARSLLLPAGTEQPIEPTKTDGEPTWRTTKDMSLAWTFETLSGAAITSATMTGDAIVLLDAAGTGYGLDRRTGRLNWFRERLYPPVPRARRLLTFLDTSKSHHATAREHAVAPQPALLGERLYVPAGDRVRCVAIETGQLVWERILSDASEEDHHRPRSPQALTTTVEGTSPGLPILLLPSGTDLLAYDRMNCRLLRIDAEQGTILDEWGWKRTSRFDPSYWNSGMTFIGKALLLYGPDSRLVDSRSGQVLCQFLAHQVTPHPLPIELLSDSEKHVASKALAAAPQQPGTVSVSRMPKWSDASVPRSGPDDLAAGLRLVASDTPRAWRDSLTNEPGFRASFAFVHPMAKWCSSATACRATLADQSGSVFLVSCSAVTRVREESLLLATCDEQPTAELEADYPASSGLILQLPQKPVRQPDEAGPVRITPHGLLATGVSRDDIGHWFDVGVQAGCVLISQRSGLSVFAADSAELLATVPWPAAVQEVAATAHSLTAVPHGALSVNASAPTLTPLLLFNQELLVTRIRPDMLAALKRDLSEEDSEQDQD